MYTDSIVTDTLQWSFDTNHVDFERAWDLTVGEPGVIVGVFEALTWDHPDLERNIWINVDEDSNGNGSFEAWPADSVGPGGLTGDLDGDDDDGNGYVDDVVGYTFYRHTTSHFPPGDTILDTTNGTWDASYAQDGHGSSIAGVIAAQTHNSRGGVGGAGGWGDTYPGVKIMILNSRHYWDIYEAVLYGQRNGAAVFSISFGILWGGGDPAFPANDTTFMSAIDSLLRAAKSEEGIVTVAAAGNKGVSDTTTFPAGFGENAYLGQPLLRDSNLVLAVGMTVISDSLMVTSNFGDWVDVAAPAAHWVPDVGSEDNYIYTTRDRGYGTSHAAPVVAAQVALLKSFHPLATADEICDAIKATVDSVQFDPVDPHWVRHGRVNAHRSLLADALFDTCDCSPGNNGDFNDDRAVNVLDVVALIAYVFQSGPDPPNGLCPFKPGDKEYNGNQNCDAAIDVLDVTYMIAYVFQSGPVPCDTCTGGGWPRPLAGSAPRDTARVMHTVTDTANSAVGIDCDAPIAGIQLEFAYDASYAGEFDVQLTERSRDLQTYWSASGRRLRIGILDKYGEHDLAAGTGQVVTIKTDRALGELSLVNTVLADAESRALVLVDSATALTAAGAGVVPLRFALHPNRPNPFNAGTVIPFSLPEAGRVKIEIFDVLGRRVVSLSNAEYESGHHIVVWDGRDADGSRAASGVYFVRIHAGTTTATRKMTLLK